MIMGKVKIFIRELLGSRFTTLTAFLVIVIAATLTISFYCISSGARGYVEKKFSRSIKADIIRVTAPEKQGSSIILSFFTEQSSGFNEKKFMRLKKIKHTKTVEGLLSVNIPAQAGVRFMNYNYKTDLMLVGASYNMIKKDIEWKRKKWRHKNAETPGIPLLLPQSLLNTYNNGLAAANGMPKVSIDTIKRFPIDLNMGYSSVSRLDGYFFTSGTVIAATDNINVMGLVIPVQSARGLNRLFGRENRYLYADILPSDHRYINYIKKRVKSMGLVPSSGTEISGKIVRLIKKIDLFTKSMLLVITLLAVISVALCCVTSLWNRIEYYRTLRMLGASRVLISLTVIFKFSILGISGGFISVFLAEYVVTYVASLAPFTGLNIPVIIEKNQLFLLGLATIIPGSSTIPGIIRIFYLEMNRN